MNRRTLLVSLAFLATPGAALAQHDHGHPYSAPDPATLGGEFTLSDTAGGAFTQADLGSGWTLLYFGYGRCREACPIALPTLADAAADLRARGVPARAVFVDVETAPMPLRPRASAASTGAQPEHAHPPEALAELARQFTDVTFLHGTRGQVRRALAAFRVRAEHVPARPGETGHSINHTTAIYVVGPGGAVAGYLYHTVAPRDLAAYVLARARPR